jgi:hypothetical protein
MKHVEERTQAINFDTHNNQLVSSTQLKDDDIIISGEGQYNEGHTHEKDATCLNVLHKQGEEGSVQSDTRVKHGIDNGPPHQLEVVDDDSIGRSEVIKSMQLDENKEGGDDPFTLEEITMLDEAKNKIKDAIFDPKKTKVSSPSAAVRRGRGWRSN